MLISAATIGALWAGAGTARACSAPECTQPVPLPFDLPFSSDQGGIAGTGFKLVDGPLDATRLTLSDGMLKISATSGIAYRTFNSQQNALGVAVPADGRAVILETTLVTPPVGSGAFEQAGIWYGTSQDDYVKLVLISRDGLKVHMLHEGQGKVRRSYYGPPLSPPAEITLRLRIDTAVGKLTGAYELPGQPAAAITTWPLPVGLVTAGISRGGIFATRRLAKAEIDYSFDRFQVRCSNLDCPAGPAPHDPGVGDGTDPVGVPDEGEVDVDPPPVSNPPATTTTLPGATGGTNPGGSVLTPGVRPSVTASSRRRIRLRALRRRGLAARVRCTEKCDARLDLVARKKGKRRLMRIADRAWITGGLDRRVTLTLTSRAARRLAGVRKLELRVQARFTDGSTASLTRGVELRR